MKQRFRSRWRDVVGIDLRSLALFRVALGSVLLASLLLRLRDLTAFYADAGVMPRHFLLETTGAWTWSLHLAHGSVSFHGAMLAVQCLLALAVVLGYRARAAVVLSWLLLASLHGRNPLILSGADDLLVCLLFWAMFLPVAARYSVDAALSTRPPPAENLHVSWASAALVLQVVSVYFFSAILKSDPAWWPDGTAVRLALELDRYATPAGQWLKHAWPGALRPLTYFVWFLELLGPILILSPWLTRPLRLVTVALLALMHAGFILFLAVGHFPFVSLASLTVLLGGWLWDRRARQLENAPRVRIFYDRDCAFCFKSCVLFETFLLLPRVEIRPAQDNARANALMQAHYSWVVLDDADTAHLKWPAFVVLLRHSPLFGWLGALLSPAVLHRPGNAVYDWVARHRGAFGAVTGKLLPQREQRFEAPRAARALAGAAMLVVLAWNLGTIRVLPPQVFAWLGPVATPLNLDQRWNMFAPYPRKNDGWFVIPGRLEDGAEVDVLHPGRAVSYAKPASVRAEIGNSRWQKYQQRLNERRHAAHRRYFARYLCRQWNADAAPGRRLASFTINYMTERTLDDGGTAPVEQNILWHHECLAPPAAAKNTSQKKDPEAGASSSTRDIGDAGTPD